MSIWLRKTFQSSLLHGLVGLVSLLILSSITNAQTLDGRLSDIINAANPDDASLTLGDDLDDEPLSAAARNAICDRGQGITGNFVFTPLPNHRLLNAAERAVVQEAIRIWRTLLPGVGPLAIDFSFASDFDGDTLGVTRAQVNGKTEKTITAQISFSSNVSFFVDPTPGTDDVNEPPLNQFDLLTTALHEICHAIGMFASRRVGPFVGPPSGGISTFDCTRGGERVQAALVADPSDLQIHVDPTNHPGTLMVPDLGRGVRIRVNRQSLATRFLACVYGFEMLPDAQVCSGHSGFNLGRVRGKLSRQLNGSLFLGLDLAFDPLAPLSDEGNPFDSDGNRLHAQTSQGVLDSIFGFKDNGPERYRVQIDFGDNGNPEAVRDFDLEFTLESNNGILPAPPFVSNIQRNFFGIANQDIQFSYGPLTGPGLSPERDIEFRISELKNSVVFGLEGGRNFNNVYFIYFEITAESDCDCSNPDSVSGLLRLGQDADIPQDLIEVTKGVACGQDLNNDRVIDAADAEIVPREDFRDSVKALPSAAVLWRILIDNASPSERDVIITAAEDPLFGGDILDQFSFSSFDPNSPGELAFGDDAAVANFASSHPMDITNVATITGDFGTSLGPAGVFIQTDEANVDVVMPDISCEIDVARTANIFPFDFEFTLTVSNVGETALENIVLTSSLEALGFVPPAAFSLGLLESTEIVFVLPVATENDCAILDAMDGSVDDVIAVTADLTSQVMVVDGEPCIFGEDGEMVPSFLQTSHCEGSASCIADEPSNVSATMTVEGEFIEGGRVVYTVILENDGPGDQEDNDGPEFEMIFPGNVRIQNASTIVRAGGLEFDQRAGRVTYNGVIGAGGQLVIVIDALVLYGTMGQEICVQGAVFYDGLAQGTNSQTRLTDDPDLPGVDDATCLFVPNAGPTAIPALSNFGLLLLGLTFIVLLTRRRRYLASSSRAIGKV